MRVQLYKQSVTSSIREMSKPPVIFFLGFFFQLVQPSLLKRTLTVFVYHDVTDDPEDFSSTYNLNVPPRLFEYQISFIKKHFNLVSPKDLMSSQLPERAALITFDDGLHNIFSNALPIMTKLEVPCLLFLNMGPVMGESFWSGLITYLCNYREDFIQFLKIHTPPDLNGGSIFLRCSEKIVDKYLKYVSYDFKSEVSSYVGQFANPEDLRLAAKMKNVFFGNHLFNHHVPALMNKEDLLASFIKNRELLKQYPNYLNLFAFPFGQPVSCFSEEQVALLLRHSSIVFSGYPSVNYDLNSAYLDRIEIREGDDASFKIWFRIFRHRLSNTHAGFGKKIQPKLCGLSDI